MKAITTITITKELDEESFAAVKNMVENDPKQLKDGINLIKTVATDIFGNENETIDVNFRYYE